MIVAIRIVCYHLNRVEKQERANRNGMPSLSFHIILQSDKFRFHKSSLRFHRGA